MRTPLFNRKRFVVAGAAAAVVLFAAPAAINGYLGDSIVNFDVIAQAQAEEGGDGGHKGSMGGNRGGGTQGHKGAGGEGSKGGKGIDKVLEEGDDDSDRPVWAGGDKESNPHRGDPNPTPGDMKGEDFGDLYVLVRDPMTGAPIMVDGEYQVCLDPACTETALTVDGEVPEGVTPIEVEFGRANVVRAPEKVTQHSLDEVLAKLAAATTITVDLAGRLVIDGATVDSPLENLALYDALLSGDPKLTPEVMEKLPADVLTLAAAALAGGADKTGTITVDFVVYQNVIMDIVNNDQYYNYDDFDYDRSSYDTTYDYFYMDGDAVTSATVNLKDYLEATQPALDGAGGITLFSIAADDALEVIELIHTQIHESTLPGTVAP